jgi:lysozyme family protein
MSDYSDQFYRVMAFVLRYEGGYVNHPEDPGGETKYGISKRSYPNEDIKNLTLERALQIYHENYWRAISGDDLIFIDSLAIMDFAVHSGTTRALQYWRETGGDVAEYVAARLDFLTSLNTFPTFGRGWTRRLNDLQRKVNEHHKQPETELFQVFYSNGVIEFKPQAVSVGRTNSGRVKLMVRI